MTAKQKAPTGAQPQPLAAPEPSERAAIAEARKRLAGRRPRFSTNLEVDESGGVANIGPEHSDRDGWLARLEDLFGSNGRSFAISQLHNVLKVAQSAKGYDRAKVNALLAAIEGAAPTNEVQAMLAVQMAVTHEMAMQAVHRAMRVDQIPQYDAAGGMAVKLMRTFAMQVEALAKLQRGGEQIVKVVHVHPGGQAVVGTVVTGGSPETVTTVTRGGAAHESYDQPHAKGELPATALAPMRTLRSEDPSREPVPVARSAG